MAATGANDGDTAGTLCCSILVNFYLQRAAKAGVLT